MGDPDDGGGLDETLTATPGTDLTDPGSAVPLRAGRYELLRILGAGGMGVVYRARDPELGRDVAIKVVRAQHGGSSGRARLLREAQAMARLRHPNVVPIFDVGPSGDAVFVAMPLMEGGTLKRWLAQPRGWAAVVDRFVAAGRGLAAAHAAGLIHRDFKPENVLLGADGEVQVADFGIARMAGDDPVPTAPGAQPPSIELTRTGDVLGTPAYMSPEQLRGQPSDARADQFSFCVSLWEGVYGERPFAADASTGPELIGALLDGIVAGPPRPPPRRDVPGWLAPILDRGLHADPEARWPSMQALLDAITARLRPRRGRWIAAAIALATAAVAAIVWLAIRPATPSPATPPPATTLRVAPITGRGDLGSAAISPDGARLAMVAGGALIVRDVEPSAADHVLIPDGVAAVHDWSPDGRRLLATTDHTPAVLVSVDAVTGERRELGTRGVIAAFLSNHEIARALVNWKEVWIDDLDEGSSRTCPVPGEYAWLSQVIGSTDGSFVVMVMRGDKRTAALFFAPDCRIRGTYDADDLEGLATSDRDTWITLVHRDGFNELVELSRDAAVLSRRRVSSELQQPLGRRHDTDFAMQVVRKTYLDRIRPGGAAVHQLTTSAGATFDLSPDGSTLAWIELRGSRQERGPLRLSSLEAIAQRGRSLLEDAVAVAWSPDGTRLGVTVEDAEGIAVVVMDPVAGTRRRLPLTHLERNAPPLWLDDHRIAAQNEEHTTYEWIDLDTGARGDLFDRTVGWGLLPARSPRDGTIAFYWNRIEGNDGIWLMPLDGEPGWLPLPAPYSTHLLLPGWSPEGALYVQDTETGAVIRVDPRTAAITPVTELSPSLSLYNSLMFLPGGDLLTTQEDITSNVAVIRPE